MSEQEPEKKLISRTVTIALGIICIILVAGLSGTIAYYTVVVRDRDNTITNKNNQILSLDSQLADKNGTISSLNNQLAILLKTSRYVHFMVWVDNQTVSQPAHNYTSWMFPAPYTGYVVVDVQSSTTSNTQVEVVWSAYGGSYDTTARDLETNVTVVFPVMAANIEINVGNYNSIGGASETITITYCYYYLYNFP